MAHAGDLRDQHPGPTHDVITLVRGLVVAGEGALDLPMREAVSHVHAALAALVVAAPSFAADLTLLCWVARLTLAPRTSSASDLAPLRDAGWSAREIHDAVHVVACFSYMNRVADGLGVSAAPDRDDWAVDLLGAERVAAHKVWARR